MKRFVSMAILALFVNTTHAANYKIDSLHTHARFEIDHLNTSTNAGGIYGLEGKLQFDIAKRTGSIDIKLPIAKLQTGATQFTEHLKSADLFNAQKFPNMRFQSTQFVFSGNKLTAVQGKLTLLGQTHPVTLTASKFNCYQSPILKTEVCGGDFTTTIDRSKWGMNYLVEMGISKHVKLNIQIEAGKE